MINEIDSETLQARIAAGEPLLLVDIRTPNERLQGAIPHALPMPMHTIPLRLSELPTDQDVVLYCHSGARSYQATAYLVQHGLERVINLRGGIIAWARHGFPLEIPTT
ncbi:sulfurtransferase [Chromatium okenii]|uniref:rhodanese-like domain-containing protein n=1 Tax=Chromatium okenii TaxID=61644 RepID=UPI00190498BB|nr:sulfurtransferase [Chromatium okenii]